MGGGMVIDLEHLAGEIKSLHDKGVELTPENLIISDKAFICLPYHKRQDILEEERLADKKYGSTRRGIAPVYGDKYMKKGIRMGDLFDFYTLKGKVEDIVKWKNIIFGGYGSSVEAEEIYAWLERFGKPLIPHIVDTTKFLTEAQQFGKDILFEAQLGALRDIDFGIYPYTTSSQTLASYATTGAGIPGSKLDRVVGVMKAYSSCVGEGPFTAEMFGEEETPAKAGAESVPRPADRVAWALDVPQAVTAMLVQGADSIALTKLDVLSYLDRIRMRRL